MDFETFKEELANSVKERLDSRGSEVYSVTLNKVDKANETFSLSVRLKVLSFKLICWESLETKAMIITSNLIIELIH